MTISSALNAAVTGLLGNASRMGVISDNIANSSTHGYKAAGIMFNSVVLSRTNSRYIAGGVTTNTVRDLSQQGAIAASDRWGDLAVSGGGFLPVRPFVSQGQIGNSQETVFTTTGSFTLNSDGFLTSPSGYALLGWKAESDGSYSNMSRTSLSDLSPINIDMNSTLAVATQTVSIGANLPAYSSQISGWQGPHSMPVEYYDGLGAARDLDIEFAPTMNPGPPPTPINNSWSMTVKDDTGAIIGTYDITFGVTAPNNGQLVSVTPAAGSPAYDSATGKVNLTTPHGTLDLEIGKLGADSTLTQFASAYAPIKVVKDGAPAARLTSFEVNKGGELIGYYENGESRTLYKIPLANMPNPDGMTALDNQTYSATRDSGNVFLWDSGTAGVGTILSGALEQSTTDIATELTNMIQTQRAYSSNSKVVQTVDDMLQETANIKR